MKTKIIQIGNSKGLRLSKTILEKYEISESVELILQKDYIELRPIKNPREGWDEAFKQMHEEGDDELLIDDIFEDEQIEEWK
jgi:antitoxin MazE